ncbi:DUF4132 domain-containing protein [Tahibacter amnicola]|uniref:DUF4132 domain-containing protein n=1 Tax=Tahibacter amnicola TaxID=2976241 RepID=A0ABY6BEH3_9GAMM|nr:DUF4132 domain-containing protein [Tahibacter amnicola]UXI67016.1 DUF4132 domain-containing protein [Tahibacter amnicola]
MTAALRADLLKLTPEALAQLANLGLVKRAQRELAAGYVPQLTHADDGTVSAIFPDQVQTAFPPGAGLKEARCSCGATLCRHRIATVLHYAATSADEAPAAAPAEARFADLDEQQIRDQTTASLWAAVEREARSGIRIDVERSHSADRRSVVYTARLPHATARFYAGADLAFARCDCTAQQRCEHIALGALALKRAGDIGDVRLTIELGDRRDGDHKGTAFAFCVEPYRHLVRVLLAQGLANGAADSPHTAQALNDALQASRNIDATWLTLCLEAIEQWLDHYHRRSARFSYGEGVQLLRELSLRVAVAQAGTAELSPRAVLGMGEAMETAMDRLGLISLGMRLEGDGADRCATLAVVDCDTQTLLCLQKTWQRKTDDGTSELAQLDQQRVAGSLRLGKLAQGTLVTTTARRRANGELKLGQSFAGKASVTPHTGDWSALRPPLLIESQKDFLRQETHAPPRDLLARSALPGFHVLRLARVMTLGFDPAQQRLHAIVLDPGGSPWHLVRDYAATTPGAFDAIARALRDVAASPRPAYAAGPVRRHAEGLTLEPWALSVGRLVVPDATAPDGTLAEVPLINVPTAGQDPLRQFLAAIDECLCEVLRDGLRRHSGASERLGELLRRCRDLGLAGTGERGAGALLQQLSTHWHASRQGERDSVFAAATAFGDLVQWTALARHAAASIDLDVSEGKMTMQRFELVEGTASKFWEISRDGCTYTVRFGRIGTNGQTQSKTAPTEAKAQAEVDKLIKEKTGKGYSSVAVAAGARLDAVAVKPARPAAAPAAPAQAPAEGAPATLASTTEPVADPSPPAPTGAPVHPGSIPMPSGQFQFTPAMRKLLPVQRGFDAPAQPQTPQDTLWGRLPNFVGADQQRAHAAISTAGLSQLAKQFPIAEIFTASSLSTPDAARWEAAMQLATALQSAIYGGNIMMALLELCVVLHGAEFAVGTYLAAMAPAPSGRLYSWVGPVPGVEILHEALARCTDEEYARAKAALPAQPRSQREQFARGVVFHTEPDLVADAIAVANTSDAYAFEAVTGLSRAQLTLDQAASVVKSTLWRDHTGAPILAVNLARLHGAASLPLAMRLYEHQMDSGTRARFADIVRAFDSPDAFAALLMHFERKEARVQIDEFAKAWPFAAMQAAAALVARSRDKDVEAWLTRMLSAHAPLVDALSASLDGAAANVVTRLCSKLTDLEDAPLDALPDVLRDPPWLKPVRKVQRPELPERPMPEPRMQWPPGVQAKWRTYFDPNDAESQMRGTSLSRGQMALKRLVIPGALWEPLLTGEIRDLTPHLEAIDALWQSTESYRRYRDAGELQSLPDATRQLLWNNLPGFETTSWGLEYSVCAIVAVDELSGLPGLLRSLEARLDTGLMAALPVGAAPIAPFAVLGLSRKKARPHAMAWLRAHTTLASTALLAQAASGQKKAVEQAEAGLRWLAANTDMAQVREGARHFGDAGEALLDAILSVDPLSILPQKPRPLPAFFLPGGLARPRLHDGRAVPVQALGALATLLQVSVLDEAHAGIDIVKQFCTPASLDDFAWDLFQAWNQSGAPSKESWAFTAIGHLGGDACVRQLTPLIRAWPGESQHARAVTGLDILSRIGSDLALMNLNGIAQKAKFKGLQDRAKEKIQAIAEARELTTEELGDRLVPDLDLDADGTLRLDFGPRQFTVGFDEQLRPFAKDASGARLKDLPKPLKTDDASLAQAASDRWKLLKKDMKTIASNQIQRLELAMCSSRTFEFGVFQRFFVQHPLQRHLTQRLLWGVKRADGSVQGFRVAEDLSFADRDDLTLSIAEDAIIVLPHVLTLSAEEQAAFGQIFADYEILQPFMQLGREVLALDDDEIDRSESQRFKGKRVAIGSVYGLQHRGWRNGSPQDSGWISWFEKSLPGGLEVQIELDPGTIVGDINYNPKQTLGALTLRVANTWDEKGKRPFSALDPVSRSELLRDIDRLTVLVD